MFGTIRRHQTWLWAIIIVVIIISFVFLFSPDVGWGKAGRTERNPFGTIDGKAVTEQEFRQSGSDVRMLYFFRNGKWPEQDERARQTEFDVNQQALQRLIWLAKVREEKIRASDEAVGLLAQRLLGPKTPVDAFVKEYLQPGGISELGFERFLRNQAAIEQLAPVAGLSGQLIPPREIESLYREEHEELELQAIFLFVSNYLANVTVSEPALLQWYTNNMSSFRIPEKVRVSYVDLNSTNFLAEADKEQAGVTNLSAAVEQVYLKQGAEAFKDESGKTLSKEEALKKIKDLDRHQRAMKAAYRKAIEFASKLYDEKDHRVEGFEKFAAAQGLPTRVSAPFDELDGPTDLKVPETFSRLAFALTNKEEAVAFQPVEGENSFYVVAFKERIPSSSPSLESIRPKVVERYRLIEAQKLLRQAALSFQVKLTDGLTQGKTFAVLATEAGFKVVSLPPLARVTRELPDLPENISLPQVKNVAFSLQPGKASSYMPAPSMDGGYFLFLRGKLPIKETEMKKNLPEYAASMRLQRQNEAFGMWLEAAQKRSGADLPLDRNSRQGAPTRGKPPGSKPAGAPPKTR
jgi:hypothetical protein